MQVSCRNQQPQSVQKQTDRETKTPPEMSPNSSRYLNRCRQRFCLTEQNSYMMSIGSKMMGKTRKCTQRPQITQAVYLLNLLGCRSTMPFFCLSSAVMLPWAQPPKQKQRKAKARVMVMASQLPRVERQIRKGLVQMMELMRIAPLTLSPPFRSANILKMKKHAAMSKKARRYLPKFWSYLQEGDMIQASTGLQRQVCRQQGESKREASRKTLQSRSVNALNLPSKMLSPSETLLMIQILSSSPRTARTSHFEQSIVDDSPFILLMQPVLQL